MTGFLGSPRRRLISSTILSTSIRALRRSWCHTHIGASSLMRWMEKAHRLIWDLFLQMLDVARITLADHRIHDLSGFYVVCASNIGSQQLMRPARLPFATLERAVLSELHRHFRLELIGRFILILPTAYFRLFRT